MAPAARASKLPRRASFRSGGPHRMAASSSPYVPSRWPLLGNLAIALWLLSSAPTLGHGSLAIAVSDAVSAVLLATFSVLAWRRRWVSWLAAGVGIWLTAAPLVLWAPTAAAYNNDTLLGALAIFFSVVLPRLEADRDDRVPPGWSYNPSDWVQRLPIVSLALLGFFLSRHLAAYQLGHVDTVWEPFFGDGTAKTLESKVSQAFPVSDAGLGAWSYLLDALAGLLGGRNRWRSMPWMVLLFGFFIIPPGVTSIVLVTLQPIGVGAWCTVCLITAVVMLAMVPPAVDEVIATVQFLRRTKREGGSLWRAVWRGEGSAAAGSTAETDHRSPWRAALHGVEIFSMPWTLWASALVGAWLMSAPGVLGLAGDAAKNDYIAGALVATIAVVAAAEPTRIVRLLNVAAGAWLLLAAWILDAATAGSRWSDSLAGLALIGLSLPRGKVTDRYDTWDRWVR